MPDSKFYLQKHIAHPPINSDDVRGFYPEIVSSNQLWDEELPFRDVHQLLCSGVYVHTKLVHVCACAQSWHLYNQNTTAGAWVVFQDVSLKPVVFPIRARSTSGMGKWGRTERDKAFLGQTLG